MHIALIQNVPFFDHRMVHTDNVARELLSRGYKVDVIINDSMIKSKTPTPYTIVGISGETYSVMGQINFSYNLYKFLQKKKYNVIHAKNPFSSILPALLQQSNNKIIYDIRGLWIDFGVYAGYISKPIAPILKQIDIYCMKKADIVIAISSEMKKQIMDLGIEEEKIKVIVGDGVNTEIQKENQDIRDYLGISGKVVGYVGTISKTRGSDKIIRAFNIIRKKTTTKIYLVMIGPISPGEQYYFKDLVTTACLKDSCLLTGQLPHDKILSYLPSFDIAIAYHEKNLPIFNVAVPTKILEYLAAECIIVTTNHTMYLNLLTHKINAYLTEPNPSSFAKGILKLLNDNGLAQKLKANTSLTAKRFSIKKIVNEIEKIYYL